jgi:hypothetical protein
LKKQQTYEQVSAKKDKAAQFLRDVVGDDDKASDVEDMNVEDYADSRGVTITNPRRQAMANGNGGDGDSDYDFDSWTKADCIDTLGQVVDIADQAFDPMSSREDMAQALSDILDALSDGDDGGDEDAEDSYSDDDDTR